MPSWSSETAQAFEECIEYSLANDLVSNAVFVGERYYAYQRCEASVLLLGEAYLRANEGQRCYVLLRDYFAAPPAWQTARRQQRRGAAALAEQSGDVRFLYARCCAAINKLDEAEEALLARPDDIPRGAAGYYHLATICQRSQQHKRAVGYYNKALEMNPFLFVAYEALCSLGAATVASPSQFFSTGSVPNRILNTLAHFHDDDDVVVVAAGDEQKQQHNHDESIVDDVADVTASPIRLVASRPLVTVDFVEQTPAARRQQQQQQQQTGVVAGVTPIPTRSPLQLSFTGDGCPLLLSPVAHSPSPLPTAPPAQQQQQLNVAVDTARGYQLRRGVGAARRVQFSQPSGDYVTPLAGDRAAPLSTPAAASGSHTPAGSVTPFGVGAPHDSSFLHLHSGIVDPFLSKIDEHDDDDDGGGGDEQQYSETSHDNSALFAVDHESLLDNESTEQSGFAINSVGAHYLLDLFRSLARIVRSLARFRCQRALGLLERLPDEHRNTAWGWQTTGRCYFELAQYRQAQRAYSRLRLIDPACMAGMDYYSVALWQLQDEVALSGLAQELTECNRLAPQTWCAVGNCFSLQKEHLTALKFFQRAVQLSPAFAYTYSLCGHEYIATDDLDKAMQSFRKGIRYAPNQYNAWYGLGLVFMRQKKFDLAYYHFTRAQHINPNSSIICLHLGMAMREQGRFAEACEQMEHARRLDPQNILASFHHASVLRELKQYDRCIEELRKLLQILPAEAPIYMLLGKICHRQRQYDRALTYFHTALDLSPRDAPTIKPLIERITNKAMSVATEKPAQATPTASAQPSFEATASSSIDHADELVF